MTIKNYGVWVGTPVHYNSPRSGDASPHLDLKFEDNNGSWVANINVRSTDKSDSRLVYWMVRNFQNDDLTNEITRKGDGYHPLGQGQGLDYIRGGLISLSDGEILPYSQQPQNDTTLGVLEPILKDAITNKATIYLFGSQYVDGPRKKGIHDIHMNQGSLPKYENGVGQDGGFFLQFPDGHWEAVLLAFASQTIQSDDSGAAVQGAQTLGDVAHGDGDASSGGQDQGGQDKDDN
jgi:uncharacterized protein YukJ